MKKDKGGEGRKEERGKERREEGTEGRKEGKECAHARGYCDSLMDPEKD